MKAGLISFHNAYNYGAALQAFALQDAIENLGVACEYIDYINPHRRHAYDMKYQFVQALREKKLPRAAKVVVGTPFILLRGRKFKAFYAKRLKKSDRVYTTSKEAARLNGKYDRFVVGSDQVWNPDHNGGDTAFLLDFVQDPSRKISYASSFSLDVVPANLREAYAKALSDFGYLSTREGRGIELIHELTGRKAQLVLDPVFLVGREKWDAIRKESKWAKPHPYVFFYTNSPSQVNDFLCTGFDFTSLDRHILSSHVTPGDFLNPHTRVRVSMSPEDFLNEIAGAELVVTASFHCLAFSILFERPFCVILTGNYGRDERMINLLRVLGLEDRILTPTSTGESFSRPIDYAPVREKLRKLRDESLAYLTSALRGEPFTYTGESSTTEYFCEDERCTGCTACMAICPRHAIIMVPDAEGFKIPVRDEKACVNCGLCHQVCQALRTPGQEVREGQRYFAAKNTEKVRQSSSSGGVFTAISDYILAHHGVVIGAGMTDDFRVIHSAATTPEQRDALRGTCYVQSDLGDTYEKVRQFLQEGKQVLFTGTPCQVEGLKLFLGKKPENLILCDIVCHGVPSPLAFRRFIDFLSSRGRLTQFRFRDKTLGWRGYTTTAVLDGKTVHGNLWLNSFTNLSTHSVVNRLSCASCRYTNYNRPGDFTIGDFWGIEKSHPEYEDKLGVSLLMVNTADGNRVLQQIKGLDLKEVSRTETKQNSLSKPPMPSAHRYQAFRMLQNAGYEQVAKKYGEWNTFGLLKNILRKARK